MADNIDITINETVENIDIVVNPNLIEVNITKISGASVDGLVPYIGATDDVNLGSFDLTANNVNVDVVNFDLNPIVPTSVGSLYWDAVNKTLSLIDGVGATTLQIGQEERVLIKNTTGTTLTDGKIVYITGATGNLPSVSLASALNETTSAATLGMVTENIPNGSSGFVTITGLVNGLNTLAFNEGDILWLSNTAGEYTNIKPTSPSHLVLIGYVTKKSANGSIYVKIQNTQELNECSDVLFGTLSNNDLLVYESSTGLWKNKTAASVGLVSGTGTTNYLPKFTGSSTLGNSNLSDNETSVNSLKTVLIANLSGTLPAYSATYGLRVNGRDSDINGVRVGKGNSSLSDNTVIGVNSGSSLTTSNYNTFIGLNSGTNTTTGAGFNTFIGRYSGWGNTTGSLNTYIGNHAGSGANSTGFENTFIGVASGSGITTGNKNSGLGAFSLLALTEGALNTAIGYESLLSLTTTNANTAIGYNSGRNLVSSENVLIGNQSGFNINSASANRNTFIGTYSMQYNNGLTGNLLSNYNSIAIGYDTRSLSDGSFNEIVIGYEGRGLGSNSTVIGNSSTTLAEIKGQTILGKQTSAPTGVEGAIYYNSTTKKHYGFDGTTWNALY